MVIIEKKNMAILHNEMNWQEAIQQVGKLLLDAGSIEHEYIQNMIDSVNELGPYIVIAPHIAIAHARPGKAVLQNDIALVVLKKPVAFHSKNDPVMLLFGLCAIEPNQHIHALTRIAQLLSDPSAIDEIIDATDVGQLFALIHEGSNDDASSVITKEGGMI